MDVSCSLTDLQNCRNCREDYVCVGLFDFNSE